MQPSEHLGERSHALTKLCLAKTCRIFEEAARRLLATYLSHKGCYFIFAPAGAIVPAYFPDASIRGTTRRRFRDGLSSDHWYRSCPAVPGKTRIIRHSDHCPSRSLQKTAFYRGHLRPFGVEYGASIVFWDKLEFQGCLTLLRTRDHGDFSSDHLHCLHAVYQGLFAAAVQRLADYYRLSQETEALKQAVYQSPEPMAVIRRPDHLISASKQAVRVFASWDGNGIQTHKLPRTQQSIPAELGKWCVNSKSTKPPSHAHWNVEASELPSSDRYNCRRYPIHLCLAASNLPAPSITLVLAAVRLPWFRSSLVCAVARNALGAKLFSCRYAEGKRIHLPWSRDQDRNPPR